MRGNCLPMKIIYLGIGYPVKGDQNIYTDLMKYFVRNGHNVTVVCSDETISEKYSISVEDSIEVVRVQTGNVVGNVSIIKKGMSTLMVDYNFWGVIKKALSCRAFDLILCSTPPITLVKTVKYLKAKNKCPVYLMLKDIFPQNAVDLGMMSSKGPLYFYFRNMERKLYKLSDYIGCMSPANIQYVIDHNSYISQDKVSLCVNSVEDRLVTQYNRDEVFRKHNIPCNSVVFLYGGSLGVPQGIDFLLSFLKTQINMSDRYFLICGKGKEAWKIKEFMQKEEPNNMKYLDWIPYEDYEALQQVCDIGMIFLNSRFTIPNFPSRLLSIIRNHKPVLAATDVSTDLGDIIVEGDMGWWCKSDDISSIELLVNEICCSPKEILSKGKNAYRFYYENYRVENTYNQIMSALDGMK